MKITAYEREKLESLESDIMSAILMINTGCTGTARAKLRYVAKDISEMSEKAEILDD
jgi:hypothetical protein